MSVTPTFQGEIQMRRWSDSSTQGVQITFALPDSDDLEPLKAKAGKRFMAVLVEIGDDEAPVEPQPRKDTRGPLCREACDYCAMPEFRAWLMAKTGNTVATEQCAKNFILHECGVESRKELDGKRGAAELFVREVRVPFMRYMQAKKK